MKKDLWNRIIWLRDTSDIKPANQLAELRPFLDKIKDCKEATDSVVILLYQRIGWLNYLEGHYDLARQLLQKSIDEYRRNGIVMKGDRALLMRSYNNLRLCLETLGELNAAKAARDSCITIGVVQGIGYDLVVPLLYMQMDDHFRLGDYYRVLDEADLGERLTRTHYSDIPSAAFYLNGFPSNKLNALVFLKKFSAAEPIIKAEMSHLKPGRDNGFLATYSQLYARAVEQYDYKKALLLYEQAFRYYLTSNNKIGCAQTLNNAGYNIFYTRLNNYPKALDYYRKALPYASGDEVANILLNIAMAHAKLGIFDSSDVYFKKAYKAVLGSASRQQIPSLLTELVNKNYSEYLIDLLLSEAEARRMQFQREGKRSDLLYALENYRLTDQVFGSLQKHQGTVLSRLFLRGMGQRLYEPAVDACLILNDPQTAFYFFEKSRAALLFEQLKDQYMFNPKELGSIYVLKKQIRELEVQVDTLPASSSRLIQAKKELFVLRQNEQTLRENIRKTNPVYFQSQFDTSTVILAAFKRDFSVSKGTFVEMLVGDTAVYTLVINNRQTSLRKIPIEKYQPALDDFIRQLSQPDAQNGRYSAFTRASSDLYRLIFGEVTFPEGPVVISPGGPYFPVEALISTDASGKPAYFIQDHAVYYTYSAAYWMNNFRPATAIAGNILGMAPVNFNIHTGLPSLRGSSESMERILSKFSESKLLVNKQATRENFLTQFGNYKIVQIYSHSSDSSERSEPVIWLADSSLYLSELIREQRPACRLIVLSACQTARGQTYIGEGVYSFNRGFAALGIPSAIANLWEADSKSTYLLTEKFYEFLAKGKATDEALRLAKLSLLESNEYNLPYYWAAPVLVGKSEVITLKRSWPKTWLYIIPATLVLVAGMIFVTRRIRTGSAGNSI